MASIAGSTTRKVCRGYFLTSRPWRGLLGTHLLARAQSWHVQRYLLVVARAVRCPLVAQVLSSILVVARALRCLLVMARALRHRPVVAGTQSKLPVVARKWHESAVELHTSSGTKVR